MADKKISALTAASTPLAGTEVLPIVQSGSTVKVSVANLTAGRTVGASRVIAGTADSTVGTLEAATTSSGATTRNLLVQNTSANLNAGVRIDLMTSGNTDRVAYIKAVNTSGGGGATDVIIATNGDFATPVDALKVDSTGNITAITGNLIQGTAAKGINFTANTPAAGMTSQLLNWYEEGTWTPTDASGAGLTLTYTAAEMRYTRMGRVVMIQGQITYPATASTATALIGGLPFTSSASNRAGLVLGANTFALAYGLFVSIGSPYIEVSKVAGSGAQATNVNLSGTTFAFSGTYSV